MPIPAALAGCVLGKIIDAAKKHTLFSMRRQVTAHDYVDGAPNKHKK
jgi:hypothetical protein